MRIFVSEFVCGGGWSATRSAGSLATEGRAMLGAIVEDLSRIPGVHVETTWDARLGRPPFSGATVVPVESPLQETAHFQRLATECDATLVVAPEIEGILHERCLTVESVSGRLLGPGSRAVALCSDKLRLAQHLREAGIETIPTEIVTSPSRCQVSRDRLAVRFPAVVKPRDGAGSQDVQLVNNPEEFERLGLALATVATEAKFVWQPYVAGVAVSVAIFFSPSRREAEVLVPAAQHLSSDGRFRYLGGRVPLFGIDRTAAQSVALTACRSIPAMRGYVGVDLVVPDNAPDRPIVVEINPRLTTSYLGYRALAESNLAEWMLMPTRFERGIVWRDGVVEFDAAGTLTR